MGGRDVLIVTQPPFEGGVPAKTRILCRHLRALGHRVTVSWYATFGHDPECNAPSWRIPTGARPSIGHRRCFDDFPGIAVGCWCPELEVPYYLPSRYWRDLIAGHDRHIAVGGPPLVAYPLVARNVPSLLWCASDVAADRKDRVRRMPFGRRIVHDLAIMPWLRVLQRRILQGASQIRGVSRYTAGQLAAHGAPPDCLGIMPIPVDCARFHPAGVPPSAIPILGFAARFEDPRKNLVLLLDALAVLRQGGGEARLRLAGAEPSSATLAAVEARGLGGIVEFAGDVSSADFPAFYRGLDVFVIPSHQEGLCIAGLEAMASGVPVVSTRCGGPSDYVRDGATGLLCGWGAGDMASCLGRLIGDRALRSNLGAGARQVVEDEFSHQAFADELARAWSMVWGDRP